MEVHKLTPEERFEANLISTVAFHMRMEDPEKNKEESLKDTKEDWGAFAEDGRKRGGSSGAVPDVADPWYTRDFETTYQDVLAGCEGMLRQLGY